jgi:tripartite-type tricarboxylate transporter receptor subunit TctC
MDRRHFLHFASSAVALPALTRVAAGQSYPTRSLRIVVGFTPGGAADTMRLIGQWLSEHLGQSVIIDNRPGASTNLSVQTVLSAPADGYTLLFVSGSQAIKASLYDNLPFDFLRDFFSCRVRYTGADRYGGKSLDPGKDCRGIHRIGQEAPRRT